MYEANDYRVQVRGNVGDSESWVNTWSFKGSGPVLDDIDAIANRLNALYDSWAGFASWQSTAYSHVGATLKVLATGDTIELDWDGANGSAPSELLPTQLAMRVSLTALGGVHGGPFLTGFVVLAVDGSLIDDDLVGDFIGALETFTGGLTTDGLVLGIDRPTIEEVAIVTAGRVGHRFDVISKRANDTAEAYSTFDVS